MAQERYRLTHERGPMTRQVIASARAWGGDEALRALLDRVSEPCRSRFQRPIGFFDWVESDLALELHHAWETLRGVEAMEDRGEDAAKQMMDGPQGWLLRMASPAFLIQNLPKLFNHYYQGGEVQVALVEPGHARIEVRAQGYPESWFEDGLPAWFRVAMGLAGARDLHVELIRQATEAPTPWLHVYVAHWKG